MAATKQKKSPAEVLPSVARISRDDDLEDILAASDEDIDAELRAAGGDPDAIAARGVALVGRLRERRDRLAWQRVAQARIEAAWEKQRAAPKASPSLSRTELLARIESARTDPRFSASLAAAFRKRAAAEATDEELRTLLDEIEMLRADDGDAKK